VSPIGPQQEGGGQVIDLMAALRESLSKTPRKPAAPAAPAARTKAPERKPAKRATAAATEPAARARGGRK
jgi:hypothetical protein